MGFSGDAFVGWTKTDYIEPNWDKCVLRVLGGSSLEENLGPTRKKRGKKLTKALL